MKSIKRKLAALWKDEEGMEMVEYAIVGAMVVAVGAAAFYALGGDVKTAINTLSDDVTYTGTAATG